MSTASMFGFTLFVLFGVCVCVCDTVYVSVKLTVALPQLITQALLSCVQPTETQTRDEVG